MILVKQRMNNTQTKRHPLYTCSKASSGRICRVWNSYQKGRFHLLVRLYCQFLGCAWHNFHHQHLSDKNQEKRAYLAKKKVLFHQAKTSSHIRYLDRIINWSSICFRTLFDRFSPFELCSLCKLGANWFGGKRFANKEEVESAVAINSINTINKLSKISNIAGKSVLS